MDDITPVAKAILLAIFLYSFHCDTFAQIFSVKGQFEFGTLTSNDIPDSCLLYTSPSPRDTERSRMPSSA